MTKLQLEVGKSYVTKNYRRGSRRPILKIQEVSDTSEPIGRVVEIVGTINPDTTEFLAGFRFFDSKGVRWSGDGARCAGFVEAPDGQQLLPLVREAIHNDLYEQTVRLRLDLGVCQHSKDYIGADHGGFIMKAGGVYVNHMGFLVLIDSFQSDEDDENWIYLSANCQNGLPNMYRPNGRFFTPYRDMKNMKDLIFQRL